MKQVGVVGLGDMGSGLAKNLIAAGFTVLGFDLSESRMAGFAAMGGTAAASAADAGRGSDVVFVMVMNGDQAKEVILGGDGGKGLVATMAPGSVVLLTATIKASEAREIGAAMQGSDIHMIDTPVSGGFPGAQGGTLTMMAAGSDAALEKAGPAMAAVGKTIHRVGTEAGMGQTVKACLQSLIGSIFSATFEASVLAAKAGVSADVLYQVFSTSGAGCGVANTALENIIERKFEGTGSHINTMYKDLTIAMDLARDLGVPLFTAATAMQLFQAGKTRYPDGDNWVVTRVIEEIVGAGLKR
ncbi:MAG: NAD(P)-dependent oxidoreductase [Kiloniellaceae bacterium]